jgi:hypothetical protein
MALTMSLTTGKNAGICVQLGAAYFEKEYTCNDSE